MREEVMGRQYQGVDRLYLCSILEGIRGPGEMGRQRHDVISDQFDFGTSRVKGNELHYEGDYGLYFMDE